MLFSAQDFRWSRKVEFRWTHLACFLRAGFGVGCCAVCGLCSLSCYFRTGTSLAVLFISMGRMIRARWNGVLGAKLLRTWVGIRSFNKAWILAALARGNDGASALATALPGLQGLQELTVNLGGNHLGPGPQGVPLEACRGAGGGGFRLFRRESRGRAAAGYARLQEIGDVRLNCQRLRWLEMP